MPAYRKPAPYRKPQTYRGSEVVNPNPLFGYIDEFRLTIGSARSANQIQTAAWPDHL